MKDVQKALEHGLKYFENQEKYLLDEHIHDAEIINNARENIQLYESALSAIKKYEWRSVSEKPEGDQVWLVLSRANIKTGERESFPGLWIDGEFATVLGLSLEINESYMWMYLPEALKEIQG